MYTLTSSDEWTQALWAKGIRTWDALTAYIRQLPYGRNSSRSNFFLVIAEGRGSCSSKHAFLKSIADLNHIPEVELILGIYRMNSQNTPKVADVLAAHSMDYIPEAHCYLRIASTRHDYTSPTANIQHILPDIIQERPILPQHVVSFKVTYHKAFLQQWIQEEGIARGFEEVWTVREACIGALGG